MKTLWMLLLMAGLGTLAPSAVRTPGLELQPMIVGNVTGNMHLFQSTPPHCDDVNIDVPVIGGRFALIPDQGLDVGEGRKLFVMTQGTVSMQPFTVRTDCDPGPDGSRTYGALSVQVAKAVSFVASPTGPNTYVFRIPAEDVLLLETAIADGRLEVAQQHAFPPGVTGTIDLQQGTVTLQVSVATNVVGEFGGSITTNLSGTLLFPDADGDGVPNRSDNCRRLPNNDQSVVASPLVTAPDDVTLHSCADTGIGKAVAADRCEGGRLTVTNDAPRPFPPGSTVVTWRAEDRQGRVRTDTQTVTIDDKTPPVFTSVPPDIPMFDGGPADLGLPTATDDCGGNPVLTNDAPARFLAGTTVVTWTATDLSGNQAFATQTVTVEDQVPPEVSQAARSRNSRSAFPR